MRSLNYDEVRWRWIVDRAFQAGKSVCRLLAARQTHCLSDWLACPTICCGGGVNLSDNYFNR